ncbi:MAG: glycosyltransferase [Planctomycetaceae bacterium]|jgi:glycosyltransferase involved in cell wall biosynthesis|nr:glycosyltransferase [Planctomycetaceae bacterium]
MKRVLQVFGTLSDAGGAEKWILDLLRMGDPRVRFDFLLSQKNNVILSELCRLGSKLHLVPFSKCPLPWSWCNPYLRGVRKVLRNNKYDAVHVHQFDLSGEILRLAAQERVPVRVMSVHASKYENPRFYRRFIHYVYGRPYIFRYATNILPCSQTAAESFTSFATQSQNAKKQILCTGINPKVFEDANRRRNENKNEISKRFRRELGIPDHAIILGHVGRFSHPKNHCFLLDLMEFLQDMKNDSLYEKSTVKIGNREGGQDVYAVLVGQGEQWEEIRCDTQNRKLEDRVILTGLRSDIPDLLCSLFDVFILPSFYEGLPIAAMEALAAGLGVVYSDRISRELDDFFPQRIRRVALDAPKTEWVNAIGEMVAARCETSLALTELATTPFTLQASLEQLISIYQQDVDSTSPFG